MLNREQRASYERELKDTRKLLNWEDGKLFKFEREMTKLMVSGQTVKIYIPMVEKQREVVERIRTRVKELLIILGHPIDASSNQKPGGLNGNNN